MSYILDALNKSDQKRQHHTFQPVQNTTLVSPAGGPVRYPKQMVLIFSVMVLIPALWLLTPGIVTFLPFATPAAEIAPLHASDQQLAQQQQQIRQQMQRDYQQQQQQQAHQQRPHQKPPQSQSQQLTKLTVELQQPAQPASSAFIAPTLAKVPTNFTTMSVIPATVGKSPPEKSSNIQPGLATQTDSSTTEPITEAVRAQPAATRQRIPWLSELPVEVQQELPVMNISVTIHSNRPTSRRTRINGMMYYEGDTLTDNLTLHTIQRDGLVFEYQRQRFRLRP